MSDELEQPGNTQDSAQAETAGGENHQETGNDHDVNPLDQDSQEQTADQEDDEEVEIGEHKFALPKSAAEKLKAERLMHADYTQKTQSVAEERKQVIAEREQVREQQQKAHQYLDEMADLRAIDKQIKQIDDMKLSEYVDTDPVGVMKVQEQRRALEIQRQQLVGNITQKQQDNALAQQQETAKQIQEAEAYIKREIPGWTEQRTSEITEFAKKNGIDPGAMWASVFKTPALAKILHNAELYEKLVKKQAPTKTPAPAAKPAIKIGSAGATAVTDPAKMTDAQFAAWRRKQIQQRK